GLIGESGKDVLPETTRILHLTQETQRFVFNNVPGPVVPSVLRGFSAPVKVKTQPSDEELVFRMAHDSDAFNKFEAAERLMVKTLHKLIRDYQKGEELELGQAFLDSYGLNVANAMQGDLAFNARMLQLPAYNLIIQDLKTIDPDAVHSVIHFVRTKIAQT